MQVKQNAMCSRASNCPTAADVLGKEFSGDHAEVAFKVHTTTPYWPPGQTIRTIRVDAADSRRIYFTVGSLLFYSMDGGASWVRKEFSSPLEYLFKNFLFSRDSVYVLDRQMRVLSARGLPRRMVRFAAGILKNTNRPIFYAVDTGGAWISIDEGRNWVRSRLPDGATISALACAEYDAANAYVVVNRVEEGAKVFYGVFRSDDTGHHWHWVWKGGGGSGQYRVSDGHNPANLTDGWVAGAFGREYVQVLDIGVAPHDGNMAVATDWYRVMKTMDGGKTWSAIYSHTLPNGASVSTGLNVTTTYGVHFDPFDSKHIAVSATDIGYHHSFDGGRSWFRSVTGVPAEWNNTCYWVVFDPSVRGKCWGAWSGVHDLPRGKMTRDPHWKAAARGGVCISTDGGRTWKPSVSGMGSNAPTTSIVMDPHSPPGKRILYAAVYNKGVFKSVDDGVTWVLSNNGIGDNTCTFEITLAGNGDLYLVVSPTPDFDHSGSSPHFYSGAVYKSVDDAATWKMLHPVTADTLFPSGIGVDPLDPQRVYLACWGDITLSDLFGGSVRVDGGDRRIGMRGGIFRSDDGGVTWRSAMDSSSGSGYVYDVTVDGHHPGRLYANSFTGSAFRSDDHGATWQAIRGYDFHWGHRVIVDENDTSRVYITTYGSGVLHLLPRVGP